MKKIVMVLFTATALLFLSSCGNEPDKTVTMYFDSTGGSNVTSVTLNENSILILPDAPTKDGYIFDGWYIDQELTTPLSSEDITFDTTDITVYAKWSRTYYISFDAVGGEPVSNKYFDVGSLIAIPASTTKDGYYFAGWFDNPEMTFPFNATFMPARNLRLYAKWNDSPYYYTLDTEGKATITGIIPDTVADTLVIPDTINSHPVVSIDKGMFLGYENITDLTLPNSIESLPVGALQHLPYLVTLTTPFTGLERSDCSTNGTQLLGNMFLPDFIESSQINTTQYYIPEKLKELNVTDSTNVCYSDYSLSSLQYVTLNEGVTTIESSAFAFMHYLEAVTIPASVEDISSTAFIDNPLLSEVRVDSENAYYTNRADLSDTSVYSKDLTELILSPENHAVTTFDIPEGVTTINASAFEFSNFTHITIPSTVTTIASSAFNGASNLKSVEFAPNSQLQLIEYRAFYNTNLQSIVIPATVTVIGEEAFANNLNLSSVTFEGTSTLETIGDRAFNQTNSLSEIVIPISVINMGTSTFYSTGNITIYCEAASQPDTWANDWTTETVVWGYTQN